MAGKFLSIEEASLQLGVDVDEVHRLVDRKQLFPMRDGASFKFKADEVTRLAAALADEKGGGGSESIDLDLDDVDIAGSGPRTGSHPRSIADVDLSLGASGVEDAAGSRTPLGTNPAGAADRESVSLFDEGGGGNDLMLEPMVSASSPGLAGVDDLVIDEQIDHTVELPGAAGPAASVLSDASAIGSALADPLESGLSLEEGDLRASGIDLDIGSGISGSNPAASLSGSGLDLGGGSGPGGRSGIGGHTSLVGEAFDLGGGDGDSSESGSVVVATESTGDSSFFGTDDSASVSFEDGAGGFDPSLAGAGDFDYAIETPFNALQIVGLVCCSLVLLFAGLVMFDLAWTIRSPAGTPFSAPLIRSLAQVFGWQ